MSDVIAVYKYVVKKMEDEISQIKGLFILRRRLLKKYETEKSGMEKVLIQERVKTLNRQIVERDVSLLSKYKKEMKPILLKYESLGPEVYDFVTGIEEKREERDLLLGTTLTISRKYTPISFIEYNHDQGDKCQCGTDMKKFERTAMGTFQCVVCGNSIKTSISKGLKPASIVDSTIKGMEKSIQYFQGKGRRVITFSIIERIKKYCAANCPQILQNIEYGVHKRGQNHETLYSILSECGLSYLDEHVNLIGNILWGWKIPDLSDVEGEFMEIFIKIRKAFLSLPKSRKSSLGKGYQKYQVLRLVGKVFPPSWFKIVKGQDRLEQYGDLWKASCEACKDPRIKYLPLSS